MLEKVLFHYKWVIYDSDESFWPKGDLDLLLESFAKGVWKWFNINFDLFMFLKILKHVYNFGCVPFKWHY